MIKGDITLPLVTEVSSRLQTGEYCRATLSSDGGNTMAGIRIGRLFRTYNIHTIVKGDCWSICASMFLGGTERTLRGNLIFHAPYNMELSSVRCPKEDSYIVTQLRQYTYDMIGGKQGYRVHKRSMKYCSWKKGWTIRSNTNARLYGIST